MNSKYNFKNSIDASLGRIPCDLILKNVQYLDVFHCKFVTGDIAIHEGKIVGTESGLSAKRTIDCKQKFLVPGFIDAHVHVESSMMTPTQFEKSVLPKGTTTAVCDPHELSNVIGTKGLEYFLNQSTQLNMQLMVMLSSCVPATHLETNGGGKLNFSDLNKLIGHPRALGLAEFMNVPGVLNHDPECTEKLLGFQNHLIDGHSPLLRGKELSAYITTGISSCHESTELSEAEEKISKGMSVWIREGSVAKDLKNLLPALNLATSTSIGFCTDDRNPLDIDREGHIDYLIREALKTKIDPAVIFRASSYSVARHYGLDKNSKYRFKIGAIAPGFLADLVLLSDLKSCTIEKVFKSGILVSEIDREEITNTYFDNTIKALQPSPEDLAGPTGNVHVIGLIPGKILTDSMVLAHNSPGVLKLSVLERYGHQSKPANGYVTGFGSNFSGAIASSVGHDSHNLIVVGNNEKEMACALKCLIESGGGFCVTQNQKVLEHLALPFGGLMTGIETKEISEKLIKLQTASRSIGCELSEPFLQLAFLSLPVIPKLKLTDKGLVDVEKFKIISVRS